MKYTTLKSFFLIALLFWSIGVFGQVKAILSTDVGSNITATTPNGHIAVMMGVINWKGDMVALGPIIKRYGRSNTNGARMIVNLALKRPFIFYTQADVYIRELADKTQLRASRLEFGAGLGVHIYNGLQLSAGIQSEDWNPQNSINSSGSMLVRLSYNLFKND